MFALIIKDHVAETLGIESPFVGKIIQEDDFEQLPDGDYQVTIDGDEMHFSWDEIHVVMMLYNKKGIDPLLHQKYHKAQKDKLGVVDNG